MKYIDRELFKHAVSLLKEYQTQSSADKDNTLIKDAQYVSNFSSSGSLSHIHMQKRRKNLILCMML
jgi:hypothetical protein